MYRSLLLAVAVCAAWASGNINFNNFGGGGGFGGVTPPTPPTPMTPAPPAVPAHPQCGLFDFYQYHIERYVAAWEEVFRVQNADPLLALMTPETKVTERSAAGTVEFTNPNDIRTWIEGELFVPGQGGAANLLTTNVFVVYGREDQEGNQIGFRDPTFAWILTNANGDAFEQGVDRIQFSVDGQIIYLTATVNEITTPFDPTLTSVTGEPNLTPGPGGCHALMLGRFAERYVDAWNQAFANTDPTPILRLFLPSTCVTIQNFDGTVTEDCDLLGFINGELGNGRPTGFRPRNTLVRTSEDRAVFIFELQDMGQTFQIGRDIVRFNNNGYVIELTVVITSNEPRPSTPL